MKPIKFRGISLSNGKWFYGDSIKHTDNPGTDGNLEDTVYIGHKVPNARRQGAMKWVPVNPETVGQSTGLCDKAGKEIYEGDIITLKGNYSRVMLWDKMSWALMPTEYYHDEVFWVMNLQHPGLDWWEEFADEFEIIGNIHDNPELINRK